MSVKLVFAFHCFLILPWMGRDSDSEIISSLRGSSPSSTWRGFFYLCQLVVLRL